MKSKIRRGHSNQIRLPGKRISILLFLLTGFTAYSGGGQSPEDNANTKAEETAADTPLRAVKNIAFKPGEVLKFRIHYGFIDAGTATLEVKHEPKMIGNRECYHIVGTGQSVGAFDWFYKVRDRYETMVDKQAMVPWLFIRRVNEGGFIINEDVAFNHHQKKASSTGTRNKKDITRSVDSLPEGVQDMLSAFYYARTLDFTKVKEGDIFPIKGLIDNEVVPLNVRFIGYEDVKSKVGTIRCMKFRPMLQEGRVFKDKEDMTIWISADSNRVPIRVQTDVLVGSIKMDLVGYQNLANEFSVVKK